MLDYPTLKIIWWLLVGVLLIGFAIMDGHDMGVGTLLPFVGRSDDERRVIINTVGPHWDGNGSGSSPAAAPSSPPGRWSTPPPSAASTGPCWQCCGRCSSARWASTTAARSTIPPAQRLGLGPVRRRRGAPLIFGVAFGNLLQGVPFQFDAFMVSTYTGTFWQLLNPFALLCGVLSSAMITMHGGIYRRTAPRARCSAAPGAPPPGPRWWRCWPSRRRRLAALGGIDGYAITSAIDPAAPSNPMAKTVARSAGPGGPTTARYRRCGCCPRWRGRRTGRSRAVRGRAHAAGLRRLGAVAGGHHRHRRSGHVPLVMPSSSLPQASLTIWDCVSSHFTLGLMFWVALIFVPIVVSYTGWAYRVMRGKVTAEHIRANEHSAY